MSIRAGVEVGGTFTDLVAIGPDGVTIHKVPSTPKNPDEGALNALAEAALDMGQIAELAHGSTVATNAVLERKGARVAFVTTKGFRDILLMQRHGRSRIYDLEYQKPAPVVARADSYEVDERILADGTVLTALDDNAVGGGLIGALREGGYGAVAVCLLNAYVNPEHEEALGKLIADALPDVSVALSSTITREFREYERASTTTLSAYAQPVVDRYLGRLTGTLAERGFGGRFSVMQSNGGRIPADAMMGRAVNALLSGPAAGVMGAARQAGRSSVHNIVTLDMGGTSTDVSVVREGQPQLTQEFEIDGLPVRLPIVDIHTIGAGGGSIVWVDDGGMLRVGPHSAGADPGPACYGRGGGEPTVTDAHVVRGTVRPEAFLSGRMEIDAEAARAAFQPIAARFNMAIEEAADAAIALANANVVRAIQIISTERGLDPRDFVLVPFGGAGPLHAAQVAKELGIAKVLVPPAAGVISAYGLIASDLTQYFTRTHRVPADDRAADVARDVFAAMEADALAAAEAMGFPQPLELSFTADMRFVGQAFEIAVPLPPEGLGDLTAEDVQRAFAEAHHAVYFFGGEADRPVEFVSFRLGLTAPLRDLPLLSEAPAVHAGGDIELYGDGGWKTGRLVARGALSADERVEGPALLEDPTATVFVPADWHAARDENDNTLMTKATP